jgi:hypothetical protein
MNRNPKQKCLANSWAILFSDVIFLQLDCLFLAMSAEKTGGE